MRVLPTGCIRDVVARSVEVPQCGGILSLLEKINGKRDWFVMESTKRATGVALRIDLMNPSHRSYLMKGLKLSTLTSCPPLMSNVLQNKNKPVSK